MLLFINNSNSKNLIMFDGNDIYELLHRGQFCMTTFSSNNTMILFHPKESSRPEILAATVFWAHLENFVQMMVKCKIHGDVKF